MARHLGLTDKPLDPGGTGWWLWALVRWADERDPESGHTVFVLRRPAVEALQQLGIVPAEAANPLDLPVEAVAAHCQAGGLEARWLDEPEGRKWLVNEFEMERWLRDGPGRPWASPRPSRW